MKLKTLLIAASLGMVFAAGQSLASEVGSMVEKKAAILKIIHKKAKKALVNSAQDQAFKDYFIEQDSSGQQQLKEKIDVISLNVQSKFHVEEMCLINPAGSEISRIVGKQIAYDLSNEEASASFFDPGFAQKPKTTYVSQIYMSPDADKWVLAYVTPVVVNNATTAILHYEHGLEVYQKALNKGFSGNESFIVAVDEGGWIVSDSRNDIQIEKHGDHESEDQYFAHFDLNGKTLADVVGAIDAGTILEGEAGARYTAAYKKVNDWVLIVFQAV